eukprot:scaffold55635_cov38-Tisochrysis_lutea.AAC.2
MGCPPHHRSPETRAHASTPSPSPSASPSVSAAHAPRQRHPQPHHSPPSLVPPRGSAPAAPPLPEHCGLCKQRAKTARPLHPVPKWSNGVHIGRPS